MTSPTRVLIASSARAGGTWLYNLCRLLYLHSGRQVYSAWIDDYSSEDSRDYHVIKTHRPEPITFSVSHIIVSHRPLIERMASLVRMGFVSPERQSVRSRATVERQLSDYWWQCADLIVPFDQILTAPVVAAENVANLLELDFRPEPLRAVVDELLDLKTPAAGSFDQITLLHPGHVASNEDREVFLKMVEPWLEGLCDE